MAKRKNHEVSRFYLKRWANDGKIWMFDIETQTIEERSSEATFAIQNYLYVPEIDGRRDDSVEEWFGYAENQLAVYLQRLDKREVGKPVKGEQYMGIVFALVGLGYRSGYELKKIEQMLGADENLRKQMEVSDDDNLHVIAVENLINIVTRQAESYLQMGMGIIYGLANPLITCERPGFDGVAKGVSSYQIPLGPYEFAMIDEHRPTPMISLNEVAGTKEFVDTANDFTIKRARKWVVANSREVLEKIAPMLTKEKVEERASKDNLIFTPLSEEERENGWSLYKGKNKRLAESVF